MIACQEVRIEDQDPWNGEEVVFHSGQPDQESCRNCKDHMSRQLFEVGSCQSPCKKSQNIPQRKFRIEKIESCGPVQDEGVQGIIDTFIYEIWNEELLDQLCQRMLAFGKIS